MAVEAGTRVGRFVIHEYLGQGDLGPLFRARGPNSGSVAIKVLRSLSSTRVRARFLVLARRLAGIRHPNLTAVLDFGDHDDAPYLVLQYIPGCSLTDLLRTSRISQPAALWLLRGIATGIDHAHQHGIVHGALKTRQVVIDARDHPLVTDFGLAPLRWPRPDGVTVVVPPANAAYAAPELVSGGQPTAAADRYAFATIAYELLTGQTPFEGEPHDMLNAQLDATPPAPSLLNPALTDQISRVLLRGLAKDPRARWLTCTELVEALADAMNPPDALVPLPSRAGGRRVVALTAPSLPAPLRVVEAAGMTWEVPPSPLDPDVPVGRLSRRSLGLGVAVLGIMLATAGSVAWLMASPPAVQLSLSARSARIGDQVVVTATNLPPQQAGMIDLHSDPLQIGTFRADARGGMREEVAIPEDAPTGVHEVTLCWEDGCHGSALITLSDRTPFPRPPASPASGLSDPGPGSPAPPTPHPSSSPSTSPGGIGRLPLIGDLRSLPRVSLPPFPGQRPTARPSMFPTRSPSPRPTRRPFPSPSFSPRPIPSRTPEPYGTPVPSPSPDPSPAGWPSP